MYITEDQAANLFLLYKKPKQSIRLHDFITAQNTRHPNPRQIAQELIDQDFIEKENEYDDAYVLTQHAKLCIANKEFGIYNEEHFESYLEKLTRENDTADSSTSIRVSPSMITTLITLLISFIIYVQSHFNSSPFDDHPELKEALKRYSTPVKNDTDSIFFPH